MSARDQLRSFLAERAALRGRPLTQAQQLAKIEYALRHCDSCNKPIDPVWRYCAWCGWNLIGEDFGIGITRDE